MVNKQVSRTSHIKNRPGRPKGSQNKLTVAAKEAFKAAFDNLGGVKWLTTWGRAEPTEFAKLYARLIPTEIANADDKPFKVETSADRDSLKAEAAKIIQDLQLK